MALTSNPHLFNSNSLPFSPPQRNFALAFSIAESFQDTVLALEELLPTLGGLLCTRVTGMCEGHLRALRDIPGMELLAFRVCVCVCVCVCVSDIAVQPW